MGGMVTKEELTAALKMLYEYNPDGQGRNTTPVRYPLDVIGAAAYERLAQLEGKAIALVVERDADGEWPAWAIEAIEGEAEIEGFRVLDALIKRQFPSISPEEHAEEAERAAMR